MKKFLFYTSILLSLLSIQGCATQQNFVKKYNSWRGEDINNLVKQIGYPDSTYTLQNKNKVYVFARSNIYSIPSMPIMGYGYGGYYGGYGISSYSNDIVYQTCKLFIETDKKGIIVKWGSRGNHCVSN
ncbi:MAG: hypothetical protein COA92_08615 [Sulfurovum sp.]|nr:MAG: hypothetical protein COA92_08615 [Sulfurovum sp.]